MGDKPLEELSRVHMKRVKDALRVLTGEYEVTTIRVLHNVRVAFKTLGLGWQTCIGAGLQDYRRIIRKIKLFLIFFSPL